MSSGAMPLRLLTPSSSIDVEELHVSFEVDSGVLPDTGSEHAVLLSASRPDPPPRSATDPTPPIAFQSYFLTADISPRPHSSHSRNRSPYSKSHTRSLSSNASLLSPPLMARAHSMPNPNTAGIPLSAAPSRLNTLRPPARGQSPLRSSIDEPGSSTSKMSPAWFENPGMSAVQTIEEDSELDVLSSTPAPALPSASAAFSRSGSLRRRPASPLRVTAAAQAHAQAMSTSATFPMDNHFQTQTSTPPPSSSPAVGPSKYNEAYPSLVHFGSMSSFSSMPSTPTSARSRSPSISSLDTIEDTPDLESEAVEIERIERLKWAAERQERRGRGEAIDDDSSARRRGSFDVPRGVGRTSSRERKRWSVCGGERRADLDLETIWED